MHENDRYFALQAIEEARKDPRQPKVGAVLVMNGVERARAHGGQVERGVHAEATLFNTYMEPTHGATLYVTLEPCCSSKHWTSMRFPRSCAQIIADRGIRRVVIGMQDPDPRIYGRGLRHLMRENVKIDWFPPDLQSQCEELNRSWADERRAEWNYGQTLFEALELHRGARIVAAAREVSVVDVQTLRICPDIKEGWLLSQTEVLSDGEPNQIVECPDTWRDLYKLYCDVFWRKKKFMDDRDKIVLTQVPWVTTDTQTLLLPTRRTKYSYVQFYKDIVSADRRRRESFLAEIETVGEADSSKRRELANAISARAEEFESETQRLINQAILGTSEQGHVGGRPIGFPHALCLHLIVVAKDSKILLTRRAPDTEYRPGSWSCSCEEHMAVEDIGLGSKDAVFGWAERALREELGLLKGEDYDPTDVRLLSVFLETDILNVSLCGFVSLKKASDELRDEFVCMPVQDSAETTSWNFIEYDDNKLIRDVLWPRAYFHPTTRYRLILALMKKNGWPQ
jgi:pyrimidine deaminase RibD-like protein